MKKYTLILMTILSLGTLSAQADITGTFSVCVGSTTPLSVSPGGSSWSSTDPGVATVDASGVVTGVSAGTTSISYGSFGKVVTVNALPTPIAPLTAGEAMKVCVGSSMNLNHTSGITWLSSDPLIANKTCCAASISGVAPGTVTITKKNAANCSVTATFSVSATTGTITGPSAVCEGATITFTSSEPGGTWISSSTQIAVGSATGIATGVVAGPATITYRFGNSSPACQSTKTFSVNATPTFSVSPGYSICVGATTSLTLTSLGATGTWTNGTPSIASMGATGDPYVETVTGSSDGVALISYTYAATGCTGVANVSVNPYPAAITGDDHVCEGASITLANSTAGGSWSSSNPTRATVGASSGIVTGGTILNYDGIDLAAMYTVTVTYSKSGCSVTKDVVVLDAPSPLVYLQLAGKGEDGIGVLDNEKICHGVRVWIGPEHGEAPCGCAPYLSGPRWVTANPGVAILADTMGNSGYVIGVSENTTTISYSRGNGCYSTMIVSVNPYHAAVTASASPVDGFIPVCESSYVTLYAPEAGGTWSPYNTASTNDPWVAWVRSTTGDDGNVFGYEGGTTETPAIMYKKDGNCSGVNVTVENCAPKSSAGQNAISGVKDVQARTQQYNLFPNPTNGVLSITQNTTSQNSADLKVMNYIGATVYCNAVQFVNGKCDLDLSHLPTGMYLLSLTDEKGDTNTFKMSMEK